MGSPGLSSTSQNRVSLSHPLILKISRRNAAADKTEEDIGFKAEGSSFRVHAGLRESQEENAQDAVEAVD